jgi:hypothetical protein
VTTVEINIKTPFVSFASPAALCVVRHRMAPMATGSDWAAYGLEATRVLAPVSAAIQGTTVSIATPSMRETTPATQIAQPKASALLPNSDVAVVDGFGGLAGIRNWSPPV